MKIIFSPERSSRINSPMAGFIQVRVAIESLKLTFLALTGTEHPVSPVYPHNSPFEQ